MDFSQDLVRGTVVPIILSLLKERAMYGYEIVKVVNARTNGQFEWREGTLYPTLHRLEGEGILTSRWQDASPGKPTGRKRKYYHITRRGLAELTRRTDEWKQFSFAVNTVLFGAS